MPAPVAVLASGGGTNLQALLDRFDAARDPHARVALVVGGAAGIGALERAERAGVPTAVLQRGADEEDALLRLLERHDIRWVVLAGYLRLVPAGVVRRFAGRMLNIHPALLPAFGGQGMYGLRVHRAVLASGACVSGATVHLVDEEYDRGRILAQWPVPVLAGDTPESLAARVLLAEHALLPAVVEALAAGRPAPAPREVAFRLAASGAPDTDEVLRLVRIP